MCVILVVFAGRKSLPDHVMMFLSFFLLVSRNIQDVLSNFKSRLAYFSRPFFSFPFSCPLFLSLDLHGVWRWYNCNKELPIIQSRERSEIYCRFVCIHIEWPKKDLQSNKSTFWTMIYPSHIMTTSCFLQLTRFCWHFERTLVFRTHLNPRWTQISRYDLPLFSPGLDERTGEVRRLGGQTMLTTGILGWDRFSPIGSLDPNGILEWWRGNNYITRENIWKIWGCNDHSNTHLLLRQGTLQATRQAAIRSCPWRLT